MSAAGEYGLEDGCGEVGRLRGRVVDDAVEERLAQLGEHAAEVDGLDDHTHVTSTLGRGGVQLKLNVKASIAREIK